MLESFLFLAEQMQYTFALYMEYRITCIDYQKTE